MPRKKSTTAESKDEKCECFTNKIENGKHVRCSRRGTVKKGTKLYCKQHAGKCTHTEPTAAPKSARGSTKKSVGLGGRKKSLPRKRSEKSVSKKKARDPASSPRAATQRPIPISDFSTPRSRENQTARQPPSSPEAAVRYAPPTSGSLDTRSAHRAPSLDECSESRCKIVRQQILSQARRAEPATREVNRQGPPDMSWKERVLKMLEPKYDPYSRTKSYYGSYSDWRRDIKPSIRPHELLGSCCSPYRLENL